MAFCSYPLDFVCYKSLNLGTKTHTYQGRQTQPNMELEVNCVYLIHIISLLTLVYLVWVNFPAEYFPLNVNTPLPVHPSQPVQGGRVESSPPLQTGQQGWSAKMMTSHMCSMPICSAALGHPALGMCKNLRPIVPTSTFGWFVQSKQQGYIQNCI